MIQDRKEARGSPDDGSGGPTLGVAGGKVANDETSLYLLLSKHLCQRRCHGPVMQAGLLVVCPLHKMTLNPAEGNDLKLTELEKPKGTQSVSRFCDLFYFIYSSLVFILSHLILFLGPHSQYMEVPRLGVESEL